MTIRDRAKALLRQQGTLKTAWSGFRYILRKTLGIHWQTIIFFERQVSEPITEVVPKIPVQIRIATVDDIDKFKNMFDDKKCNLLRQRFTRGEICFVAVVGEKVIAQQWVSYSDEYDPDNRLTVKVNSNEGYFFDTYVLPEYRNNRLHSALVASGLKYIYDRGLKKAIGIVVKNNTYSIKATLSQGFTPKRAVFDFTMFGLQYHHWHKYSGTLLPAN
jgi:GNAT superfamily N-acetyltransferase